MTGGVIWFQYLTGDWLCRARRARPGLPAMEQTVFRLLAALLGLFALLNGGRMVADPIGWFASIPILR